MTENEYKLFKLLTGERELPPKGSVDRRILDNYGTTEYARILKERNEREEDHNGDTDPWGSRG